MVKRFQSKSESKRLAVLKGKKPVKKVAKKHSIAVGFVLDGSGSMDGVRDVTIDGCNQFLNKLKDDKVSHYLFSLSIFHSEGEQTIIDQPYSLTELAHVGQFSRDNYKPDGGTPLYDAIGAAVRRLQPAAVDKFLVVIMTDGEENTSKTWALEQIQGLIKDKEALGNWTFLFLSSDLKAKQTGQSLGIGLGNIGQYHQRDTGRVVSAMASSVSCYASSNLTRSMSFVSDGKIDGVNQDWDNPTSQDEEDPLSGFTSTVTTTETKTGG